MNQRRSALQSTQTQDYLASVSDLMSGMIFLFIITLAVFTLRLAEARRGLARTQRKLTNAAEVRAMVIETLKAELGNEGIHVEVDVDQGVLRLTDRAIRFPRGEARPYPEHAENVGILARVLHRVLPCYVRTPGRSQTSSRQEPRPSYCFQPGSPPDEQFKCPEIVRGAKVDTVLIEGHTDNVPVGPGASYKDNLGLSAARSAEVLRMMQACEPELAELKNGAGAPVISVSGYGESRPIDPMHRDAEINRRIDLRFLMEPPRRVNGPNVQEIPPTARDVERELSDG